MTPVEFYDFAGMGHKVPAHDCFGQSTYCEEYEEYDYMQEVSKFFAAHPLDDR